MSEFAQRTAREARRRGFDQAPRRVVLGDGAPWIWNLADEQFPGAVQIVDLYHAKLTRQSGQMPWLNWASECSVT